MRALLALALLCSFVSAQEKPEPADLVSARRTYEDAVAKARTEYEADIKELSKKYATRLKNLQEEITRKGDLDGALAVKKEGERVGGVVKNPLDGNWEAYYEPEKLHRYAISGSKVSRTDAGQTNSGTLRQQGHGYIIEYRDRHDRITPCADGRYLVEYFMPGQNLPINVAFLYRAN